MIASYSVYRRTIAIWFDMQNDLWRSLDGKVPIRIKQASYLSPVGHRTLAVQKPKFGNKVKVYCYDAYGDVWVADLKLLDLGPWSLVQKRDQ